MPPPTAVTTAGYWGSTYWSKGYWGPDYWKQRVPVPVPPPTTFKGSGGIGGGKTLYKEELPPGVWPEEDANVATMLAGRIRDRHDSMESLAGVQQRKRQGSKEYDLKETIHGLRERVASLEDALARASAATMLPWKLYNEAKVEIERLKAGLAAAEEEQARLRALIESQGRAIADLQAQHQHVQADPDLGVQYNIAASAVLSSFPTFETFYAQMRPHLASLMEQAPATPASRPFPWLEAIAAAGGFLLTALAIPAHWSTAKTVGYTASTALAFAAVRKAVGHRQ